MGYHEDMQAAYKRANEDGTIEWHCPGRHGVIRGKGRDNETLAMLVYFFGSGCYHVKGNDVEFVHMSKVFPPPKKAWQWCGDSVLFVEEQRREQTDRDAAEKFIAGERVSFMHKKARLTGIIYSPGVRAKVAVEGVGGFTVPSTMLTKESQR